MDTCTVLSVSVKNYRKGKKQIKEVLMDLFKEEDFRGKEREQETVEPRLLCHCCP